MASDSTPGDLLGIRPVADAVKIVTQATVDAAAAFLGRICLPAAEEFGLMLRDRVSAYRQKNAVAIAQRAERLLSEAGPEQRGAAHPRLVASIIDHGSWASEDDLQAMWAGLLAASCGETDDDDSNLIFVDVLSRITNTQARIFDSICQRSTKTLTVGGWLHGNETRLQAEELQAIAGVADKHRLDRELDHLHVLGLIDGGFEPESMVAHVRPTSFGLQMYSRCRGYAGDPLTYYGLVSTSAPLSDAMNP